MRASRLSTRLLLPLGLIALVVLLGTLQYRWLGQVSEAERAQLGRTLSQRAAEFAAEFDREVGLVSSTLTIDADSLDADPWTSLAGRYDAWQERAAFPTLVRALYIARSSDTGHTLTRWSPESRTAEPLEWPDHLSQVKRALANSVPRLNTSLAAATAVGVSGPVASQFTLPVPSVIDAVPALVVPVVTRPVRLDHTSNVVMAVRFAGTDFVIIELNRDVLAESVIPTLVERYFPASSGDHYRVAIVDRTNAPMFARGFDGGRLPDELHVDASAPFFTGARSEFIARMFTETQLLNWQTEQRRSVGVGGVMGIASGNVTTGNIVAAAPASAGTRQAAPAASSLSVFVQERSGTPVTQTRIALAGWRILLQHGAGSLDQAVAQARVRNLTTSFGILGVLLAGVGLIIVNARKSERLAAQQMEFVATVSHELRTPLAVIRSAGQNLSAGVVDDPVQTRRYGQLIETEGRRLTDMVEEVLEFAGLSGNRRPLALRPVDVSALAREVVEAQRTALESAGMSVEIDAPSDDPVMADEDALRRAINNLVANAIKYAAEGRWLRVRVSRESDAAGDTRVVEVSDRGPGIPADEQARLFEPFYRGRRAVDQQIHGNGLGLSLVARIAEAHGGSVSVNSAIGGGATFVLRLPATPVPDHE